MSVSPIRAGSVTAIRYQLKHTRPVDRRLRVSAGASAAQAESSKSAASACGTTSKVRFGTVPGPSGSSGDPSSTNSVSSTRASE